MAIITLSTDFGLEDAYVGIVKGVILSINPSATIVDISHSIPPQDVVRAAYMIDAAYPYFPCGTVHLVIVDPGVGSDRGVVAVELSGHLFLAPDNGSLTEVLANGDFKRAVRVEESTHFLNPVSRTFHGRDIFAPVAARLSVGLDPGALGPCVEYETLMRLRLSQPIFAEAHEIVGAIVAVDRFGNLITNIRERDLSGLDNRNDACGLTVEVGTRLIQGISESYSSIPQGQPLAIVGSTGRLEVSVNCGNAARFFNAAPGDTIRVKKRG